MVPRPVPVISSSMHRDDFSHRGLARSVQTRLPFEVNDAQVVLLDDVLHTGRTLRAVINELYDYGRPASVKLAVLVDRGHRELPIEAQFIGKKIATADDEVVEVKLKEIDGEDAIYVMKKSE